MVPESYAPPLPALGFLHGVCPREKAELFLDRTGSLACFSSKAFLLLSPDLLGKERSVGKSVPTSSLCIWELGKPPEEAMGNLCSHCVHLPNCQDLMT